MTINQIVWVFLGGSADLLSIFMHFAAVIYSLFLFLFLKNDLLKGFSASSFKNNLLKSNVVRHLTVH